MILSLILLNFIIDISLAVEDFECFLCPQGRDLDENLLPYGGELDYHIFKMSNAPRLARGGGMVQLELTDTLCAEELKFYVLVTAEHHNILAEHLNILPEYHNMLPEYHNMLAGLKASEEQSIITVTQYKIHNGSAN